jgi:hypothetical protein
MENFCELMLRKSFKVASSRSTEDDPEVHLDDVASAIRTDQRLSWLSKEGLAKEQQE